MKCKKILAMLLALCMVLSTFVAVSAADTVVIDIFEDYEDGIGETKVGNDITVATGTAGGRDGVLIVNSTAGTTAYGLVGFALVDSEGNHIRQDNFPEEGTIEYSFDMFVPAEGGNVNLDTATCYLRTHRTFPPTGCMSAIDELKGLTTGTWQTFEGTISDFSSFAWETDAAANNLPVWLCLRPNFTAAGEMYVDNFSFTLTVPGEEEEEPELPPVSGGIEFELAPKGVAGTLEDGVYTVTSEQLKKYSKLADFSDCAAYDWLKIIPTTELDPEKTIKVSYEIKGENLINSLGQPYADRETTLRIRNALNGDVVDRTTYKTNVPVNTGVAQSVEFEIPVASIEGYDYFGVSLDMMNPLKFGDGSEYFEISNIAIEYVGEEEEPEEPEVPEVPADEITYVLTRAINAGSKDGNEFPAVGEVEEDVFTATLRNVREYTYNRNGGNQEAMGDDCGYQPWVWIMLDEDLQTSDDWYVSYDLTTEGIINPDGGAYETLKVRTRFYNENSELCGHSDHLLEVEANKGEPVKVGVQVDTSKVTGTVTKIGLVLDVGKSVEVNEYIGSDAYFSISNVEVDYGTYVAPEIDDDESDETLYHNAIEIDAPLDDASEITYKAAGVTVSNASIGGRDNVVKATGVVDNNGNVVGMTLGDNFAFQPGDVIKYSVDVYTTGTGTPNIWLRRHTDQLQPMNSNFKPALNPWAPNTWRTVEYECAYKDLGTYDVAQAPQGWETPGTYALYVRADNLGDVYLDNFKITVIREGAKPEPDPEPEPEPDPEPDPEPEPDPDAIFKTQIPSGNKVTTEADGVYTVTVADVYNNMTKDATNAYNGYVAIIPATPIPLDAKWTVTYDLEINGLKSSSSDIWVRLLDNTTSAQQSKTIGYVQQKTTKADGTATYAFTSDNILNGGGTSTATEIAAIFITFNMAPERAEYAKAPFDGYIEFSNITFKYGLPGPVPTILEVTEVETGFDNVTLNVKTDDAIDIESLVDYILIDGAAVNAENVSVEAVDANNTTVTIIGLAPGTEYKFAVTGALDSIDRKVAIASEADCTVTVTTKAEVDVEAGISNDTVTFSLTNNLLETETIHVVLLRCKGNSVIETIAEEVNAVPGEPFGKSLEVTKLGAGEYYRVFAWTYEDGAINSMANLIDLD